MEPIKLTQYSHGAGCGCKISPKILDCILHSDSPKFTDKNILVGNESRDDAAVYDMGNGTGIISTTDFFLPITDDPYTFGRIAATNAISDVYAMGGTPIMAIAILGWPVNKLSAEIAQQVVEGGRDVCREAGIMLAGGHSIDNPEPIFGLAVTGKVMLTNLKQNNTATAGCKLYLTKPLGVGALATAQKNGILKPEHANIAPSLMMQLNKIGKELGKIPDVTALTDVTGFGLLGHLREMCEGSGVSAHLYYDATPILPEALSYIENGAIPGGTNRNWDSYGHLIDLKNPDWKNILADPQTSGGLLIAVKVDSCQIIESMLEANHLYSKPIGELITKTDSLITVN